MARPLAVRAIASRNAGPDRETRLPLPHREKSASPADKPPRAGDDPPRALPAREKLFPYSNASVCACADGPGNSVAPSIQFGRRHGTAILPITIRAGPSANPPPRLRARTRAANLRASALDTAGA